MKLLVLTTEPISAQQLRDALNSSDLEDLEVSVVAPALSESALRFWMADADEAIARAESVRRQTAHELQGSGVAASASTGESDPMQAIQDALQTFQAERILVFRHPEDEQRYREDLDLEEVRERFGLPVDDTVVPAA
jgi:predicted ATP-dependent protease